MIDYKPFITMDPTKRSGKPCIRGLRVTVHDILTMLADGLSHDEITHDFPEITRDDILACLSFAADREHRTTAAQG